MKVGVMLGLAVALAGTWLLFVDSDGRPPELGTSAAFDRTLNQACDTHERPPLLRDLVPLTSFTVADVVQGTAMATSREMAYVGTLTGIVVAVEPDGTTHDVLDISADTSVGSDRGLLDLVVAPDGETLLLLRTNAIGDTELTAHKLDSPTESVVLLTIDQPDPRHNGGGLAFAANGDLLIGIGDGGGQGDPNGEGANPATKLGSILRGRVDLDTGELAPVREPIPGFDDLVWAFGLRNPFRIWFGAEGDLWVGDVGELCNEEVTRIDGSAHGQDLGWNAFEGSRRFGQSDGRTPIDPTVEWTHADGSCAVIGGTEYQGDIVELRGTQIVADLCTGNLYSINETYLRQIPVRLDSPVDVSIGPDGELWVIDMEHGVRRITATPPTP